MTFVFAFALIIAAVAYAALLTVYIRRDGLGGRVSSGLPRSHPADEFEQRTFLRR